MSQPPPRRDLAPLAHCKTAFMAVLLPGQMVLLGAALTQAFLHRGVPLQALCWLWPALPAVAVFGFLGWLLRARAARTSAHLPWLMGPSWVALLGASASLAVCGSAALPGLLLTALSVAGNALYVYWYSRLDRGPASRIIKGARLPAFQVQDLDGTPIASTSWDTAPCVLIFYRGNWCPLCSAQIAEWAARYREIEALGAQVICISPQPQVESAALAARFDVPMRFMLDRDGRAAAALGIQHVAGVPLGLAGYGRDTVFPTVLVTDAKGRVAYADQTDNYRLRPEPGDFIDVLLRLRAQASEQPGDRR
jgi:peroxiredoxin